MTPRGCRRLSHRARAAAAPGLLAVLLASGCARFEPARARREHTAAFTEDLARRAGAELARPLSLDDCIRIALRNNYEVRRADLDRELARIGRNVAFTAFLPGVAVSAGYQSYSRDPVRSEREFEHAQADLTLPILMPSTWFLYASARHGYASAGVAAHYVRQGIVLQTTANYFALLVQQDTVAALESQLAAALETAGRVQALAEEGLAARWEGEQARFAAELRQSERDRARRRLAVARSDLLKGLGLAPTAAIAVSGDIGDAAAPEGSLEDLVLRALETHPQLSLADRQVVIQDHRVRQAFCDFLPTLSIFATRTWTADRLAAQSANWVSGLAGVWKLFDGLANVARYRAARVGRRQARLERENAFLSVMAGVISAEAALRDAADAARVRRRAFEVAAAKSADYDARAREGLLPPGEALDARADLDLAQVALVQSRYQERLAIANLELAMGLTPVPGDAETTPGEK